MSPILQTQPLGPLWPTIDPFLFCAHHDDAYPPGNGAFGPAAALAGRQLGNDFSRQDGWSMYHGSSVPGFPAHPHRGFETVTIVRRGFVDHADSLGACRALGVESENAPQRGQFLPESPPHSADMGQEDGKKWAAAAHSQPTTPKSDRLPGAAARFGAGDVQWLTAGRGIVHSEMFPLLDTNAPNPLELLQIWLNLPARQKMAAPHFTMFWRERIPQLVQRDAQGRTSTVTLIAGALPGAPQGVADPLPPPPESWAAQPEAEVAIWTLQLAPGAQWLLPAARHAQTRRMLYFFGGERLRIGPQEVQAHAALELRAGQDVLLANTGASTVECLLLQGRPIGEPVAQYGPFVMNTSAEIHQALEDYRRTQFGGWPWPTSAPVHGAQARRFARHPGAQADSLPG